MSPNRPTRKPRGPSACDLQKKTLVKYMREHKDFCEGKLTLTLTHEKKKKMWAQLMADLNKLGPSKTVKQWNKYWTDYRSKIKRLEATRVRLTRKTGGGKAPKELSPSKKEVFVLMGGKTNVEGDEFGNEFGTGDGSPIVLKPIPSYRQKNARALPMNSDEDEDEEVIMGIRDVLPSNSDSNDEDVSVEIITVEDVEAETSQHGIVHGKQEVPKAETKDVKSSATNENVPKTPNSAAKNTTSPKNSSTVRDRKKPPKKEDDDTKVLIKLQQEQTDAFKEFTAAVVSIAEAFKKK